MNILVTGASKGIGYAIAQELQSIGEVFVTGRNEQALAACNVKGFCVCDLSKDINDLAKFIEDKNIDVLVNNAGEYIYGAIDKMTYEGIERIHKTNLIAPAYLISRAVPYMKKNKFGRIINIGSISGVMGEANASLYSSSKAGLLGLTKALALELAEFNITVNTINPGWVETELGENSIEQSEFSKDEILECIPQKRFVKQEENAKLTKLNCQKLHEITRIKPEKVKENLIAKYGEYFEFPEQNFQQSKKVKLQCKNCGNIFEYKPSYLMFKNVFFRCPICNRYGSKLEDNVYNILHNEYTNIERWKHFEWLKSDKDGQLEIDIFLSEYKQSC